MGSPAYNGVLQIRCALLGPWLGLICRSRRVQVCYTSACRHAQTRRSRRRALHASPQRDGGGLHHRARRRLAPVLMGISAAKFHQPASRNRNDLHLCAKRSRGIELLPGRVRLVKQDLDALDARLGTIDFGRLSRRRWNTPFTAPRPPRIRRNTSGGSCGS